jgi:UDP-4-amino-4-deoxy-L-arabinose formyltransferase/UDP-glucuronic acid dehydrogenase (UDP-4-keto-hexauronic acid decarboxylating)
MNVVLAGEESAGLQLLRALAERKDRVIAVLTTPPQPNSTRVSVWNAARDLGCETLPAELVRNPGLAERLRAEQVDLFLNVHSLHVIHEEILKAPKLGAYNLHPGPLPRYAGLNAVSWAIFRGEQEHGVTVHRIDAKIDAGPIAYQSRFPLEADDTALSLSLKCVREGIALMLRLLDVAATQPESIPSIPQDLALRQYFGREVPEQGKISWEWPASKVVNFVRACDYFPFPSPWGHPRSRLGVQEFALVKVRETGLACDVSPGTVGASSDSGVYVACRDEWIVASKLHFEGKYLPARDVLRSGDRLAQSTSC